MADALTASLPPKLYFRIGEVAELVGVEPHVLRYWEREFRTIRPTKSAKGQRVYSRRDVENLMRVRQLLYRDGFTIAGARKRLQHGPGESFAPDSETLGHAAREEPAAVDSAARVDGPGPVDSAARVDSPGPVDSAARVDSPGPVDSPARVEGTPMEAAALDAEPRSRSDPPDRIDRTREELLAIRAEIAAFLTELDRPTS